MAQQKEHPFSVGGFSSAITATEIILLVIKEKSIINEGLSSLPNIKYIKIWPIRSKEPSFNLKIETSSKLYRFISILKNQLLYSLSFRS